MFRNFILVVSLYIGILILWILMSTMRTSWFVRMVAVPCVNPLSPFSFFSFPLLQPLISSLWPQMSLRKGEDNGFMVEKLTTHHHFQRVLTNEKGAKKNFTWLRRCNHIRMIATSIFKACCSTQAPISWTLLLDASNF